MNAKCDAMPMDHSGGGSSKWRQTINNEESWLIENLSQKYPTDYATRILTEEQHFQMLTDFQVGRAWNKLRDFVGSWGLVQHFAVPILIIISAIALFIKGPGRWFFSLPLIFGLFCGWRMIALAYFSSLGW
ncbi:MAG: hypothetical protein AAF585_16230 [Verrucomicrobiota bacterium]